MKNQHTHSSINPLQHSTTFEQRAYSSNKTQTAHKKLGSSTNNNIFGSQAAAIDAYKVPAPPRTAQKRRAQRSEFNVSTNLYNGDRDFNKKSFNGKRGSEYKF